MPATGFDATGGELQASGAAEELMSISGRKRGGEFGTSKRATTAAFVSNR